MSERIDIIEKRGYKYARLKSGRLLTFWNTMDMAKAAESALGLAISRAARLADSDYDLERIEWFMEGIQSYTYAVLKHIEKLRGNKTVEERIALLRNTTGRTPEEAEEFTRKADELERKLREAA